MTADLPERPPRGPDEHKKLARHLGLRGVNDLLALTSENDPFYRGTDRHWRDARRFARLWARHHAAGHQRRVYYRAISTGEPDATGQPHDGSERYWVNVLNGGKSARLLGLVHPEEVEDQRNAPPKVYAEPRPLPPRPWVLLQPPSWELPALDPQAPDDRVQLELPSPTVFGYDYHQADQPVLLEVWAEKTGVDDVLGPLCRELGMNLVSGAGFEGYRPVVDLLRRAERHGKPAHVLYVSDFDPARVVMPVAVARQAQFWRDTLGIDVELSIEQVALTGEQAAAYQLPRAPVRVDKRGGPDRRGKRFEEVNGEGIVELDSLEAIHPGVLADLVRRAAEPYLDTTLPRRLDDARRQVQSQAMESWNAVTEGLRGELDAVERDVREVDERYRERLRALSGERDEELAPIWERLNELAEEEARIRNQFVVALPARPEPTPPKIDRSRLLFDSERPWLEQLRAFKAWLGGDRLPDRRSSA